MNLALHLLTQGDPSFGQGKAKCEHCGILIYSGDIYTKSRELHENIPRQFFGPGVSELVQCDV